MAPNETSGNISPDPIKPILKLGIWIFTILLPNYLQIYYKFVFDFINKKKVSKKNPIEI